MAVLDTHPCPGGCGTQVHYNKLACPDDWYRLPVDLRSDINRAWRAGALGRAQHVRLLGDAAAWYREHPRNPA